MKNYSRDLEYLAHLRTQVHDIRSKGSASVPMFNHHDITRDAFMLHGPLAHHGYDWWWHSFTAQDAETGEELSIEGEYNDPAMMPLVPDSLVVLIANLHAATSYALQNEKDTQYGLIVALSMAMVWVKKNGIDPLLLLMEKHEYNKTRPYKHGKQF